MYEGSLRARQVLKLRDLYLNLALATREENDAVTSRELLQLLQFAVSNSPWWAERLQNVVKSPQTLTELIQSIPRTPKEFMQQNFTEMQIQVPGAAEDSYVLHKTSGSTGQPTRIRKLRDSYFMEYDACVLVDWAWHQRDIKKNVGGIRVDVKEVDAAPASAPLTYLGDPPSQFSLSSTANTPGQMVDALVKFQAAYVYTNPVTLRLMALEQLANPRDGIVLEQVLTVSDRTDESLRELAFKAFGTKLCDRYSSEEFGFIALQCPVHNHLHVISPSVYVEIVDELGRPCDVGKPGRVLVTGLHGFAQPLLRYEIADVAQWGKPCDAGITWPVIENIVGRVRQYLPGDDGELRLVTIVGAPFLSMENLLDFQIIRFNDAVVMIAAVTDQFGEKEIEKIRISLQSIFHTNDPVHVVISVNPQWRSTWKRHEFDIADAGFNPAWTVQEILEALTSSK